MTDLVFNVILPVRKSLYITPVEYGQICYDM